MEIGIDIGGTKIAAGVVHNGRILRRKIIETNAAEGKASILSRLRQLIVELEQGKRMRIGVGVPGSFTAKKIVTLRNLPALNDVDIRKVLDRDVVLANDARCFTLAEHTFGAGKGCSSMVGITLGTGVGGGIIIDGKLYLGADHAAGEIGHIIIDPLSHNPHNEWEAVLSGPAMIRRHKERGGMESDPASIWKANSVTAKKTQEETIRLLALFTCSLQSTFDPEVMVVGGGLSNLPLVKMTNKILPSYGAKPILRQSKLGIDAGIIGAALMAKKS